MDIWQDLKPNEPETSEIRPQQRLRWAVSVTFPLWKVGCFQRHVMRAIDALDCSSLGPLAMALRASLWAHPTVAPRAVCSLAAKTKTMRPRRERRPREGGFGTGKCRPILSSSYVNGSLQVHSFVYSRLQRPFSFRSMDRAGLDSASPFHGQMNPCL